MFWFMDSMNSGFDYRFVYDDSDKSVEYVRLTELSGIKIAGERSYELIKRGSAEFSKLRYLGFEFNVDSLVKKICEYRIIDYKFTLSFGVTSVGSSYVGVDVGGLDLSSKGYTDFRYSTSCFVMDYRFIALVIPVPMLYWLLHLYSLRDFDGIMRSFCNLFGSELGKMISGFPESGVELNDVSWL